MTHYLALVIAISLSSINTTGTENESQRRLKHFNQDKAVGIQGYDPVSYFKGSPQKGKQGYAFEYKGIAYRFSSQANLDTFAASPQSYEPQYGGWCAYAMLDKDKVAINPERFKLINGKLYLYYDGLWGNTLKRWSRLLEKQSEQELLDKADANWMDLTSR